MALICVASPKGGVGKTSLVAGLAHGMRALGFQVVVIDFDVQNALRLHFGMPLADPRGFVIGALSHDDWSHLVLTAPGGVRLLPYGEVAPGQRQAFEAALRERDFLANRLAPLIAEPGTIVIADLPPGPSVELSAVAGLAQLRLTVLMADAASAALLPRIDQGRLYPEQTPPQSQHFFVINQVDPRRRLNSDIVDFMQRRYGDDVLSLIYRDEAVPEAHASQRSVFDYAPGARATRDLQVCARKVLGALAEMQNSGIELSYPSVSG